MFLKAARPFGACDCLVVDESTVREHKLLKLSSEYENRSDKK